jgi:predicted RNA binding protein YcfA (HicA-like mRNA interferase family)
MSRFKKLLSQVTSGLSDANVNFDDLCLILKHLGFQSRTRGSHHVFVKAGIEEMVNLQQDGAKAKKYQVKQVREIILKHKLGETHGA